MQGDSLQSIWNIEQQQADAATLEALLVKSKAQIVEYNQTILAVKSAGGDKAATAQLIQQNNELLLSQKQLTAAVKDHDTVTKQKVQTEKQVQAEINKSAKNTDDAANAWKRFSASVKDAQDRARGLNLTLGEGHPLSIQANADALEMANRQKLLSGVVGDTSKNVGNYHGSLITLSKGIKGLGGLGVILSRALGIDPETAMAVREAGRAIKDLSHAKDLEKLTQQATTIAKSNDTTITYANAAAHEVLAGAEVEATVAASGLRTVLMWSGIGLLIAGLAAFAYAIYSTSQAAHKAEEDYKNFTSVLDEAKSSTSDVVAQVIKLKVGFEDFHKTQKGGKALLDDYNDTMGKTVGHAKDLNEAEQLLNDNADKYIKFTLYKAIATAAFSKAADAAVEVQEEMFKKQKLHSMLDNKTFDFDLNLTGKRKTLADALGVDKNSAKKIDELTESGLNYIDMAKKFTEMQNEMSVGFVENNNKEVTKKNLQQLTEAYQKAYEDFKRDTNASMVFQKGIADSETNIYDDRLAALRQFGKEKQVLLRAEYDNEQITGLFKLREQQAKLREEATKKGADVPGINAEIVRLAKNYNDKLAHDWGETAVKIFAVDTELTADIKKLDEERYANKKDELDQEIGYEEFTAKQIEKARKDAADAGAKRDKENAEKKKKIREEDHKLEKELAEKSVALIKELIDGGYTKQKNAIQSLINQNNDYSKAETDRINTSTLNEQDKAAKLIELQASTNEKNKQFAAEQKEIDIKKARFDKAAGIAKILVDTASAEIGALKYLADPITAPLYPGIAALIAALGAVELATAIATPIPTYAKGGVHEGGPMIVGEYGSELMFGQDGSVSLSPDRATLMQTSGRTTIIPHEETMRRLAAGMIVGGAMQQEVRDTAVQDAIMKAAGMTIKAIEKNNRRTVNKIVIDPRWAGYLGQQVFGKS